MTKGHAPSRAPRVTLAKFRDRLDKVKDLDAGEPKAHTLHGDELDYEQKEKRKERSYSGSGKPNSISSILTGKVCPSACEGYTSRLKDERVLAKPHPPNQLDQLQ